MASSWSIHYQPLPALITSAPDPAPEDKAEASSAEGPGWHPSSHVRTGNPPEVISIPDHEVLRCAGRGAYGAVWLARNVMGTYRAIKTVHR